jgi:membrane protein DedA with SNARE-associated domain
MDQIVAHLIEYGLLVVFANVFLEQIGVPIPAFPTLILAGALVPRGEIDAATLIAVAVAASVLADTVWFLIGRSQGLRVLKLICRISLSPDSCVRGTEALFERAGMPSLLFAKFIPGYNTVAPPLSGAMGVSLGAFLVWDAFGTLLWVGTGVGLGILFHDAVDRMISYLDTLGLWALAVLGLGLLLVIVVKWWQRRRVVKLLRLARIGVDELKRLMEAGEAPTVIDVRTKGAHRYDPRRIPGALHMTFEEIEERVADLPREREVVLYCT